MLFTHTHTEISRKLENMDTNDSALDFIVK